MARRVSLEIVGDSSSLERAFANAANSAKKFNQQVGTSTRQLGTAQIKQQAAAVRGVTKAEQDLIKVRSRRASSLGPLRFAGVGLGAGLGLFAATQAVRELGQSLETTGAEAFTTTGRLKNLVASLTSGDLIGAVKAIGRAPKTIEDLGLQLYQVKQRTPALKEIAAGTDQVRGSLSRMTLSTTEAVQANQRFRETSAAAGTASQEQAKNILEQAAAMERLADMTDRAKDETAKLGNLFVTQSGALVTWKGAVDDLVRAGRGEAVGGTPSPRRRRFHEDLPDLSPSQRRELELIGKEGPERLALLNDRLRQLNNQMKDFHGNQEQRLKILTNIRNTEAEIAAIYEDQAADRRQAAEEAKRAAEAAAAEARRRREEARAAELARELRILEGPIPTRANLRKQFEQLQKSAAADKDFPKKLTERFAGVARLLREEIMPETREAIQAFFETVRGEFDRGADTDPLAGLKQVSTRQLAARLGVGLGLTGGGMRRLGFNISGQQIQPVYTSVQIDGREVARASTTGQTRTGKRTAKQTSGRRD